MHIVIHTCVQDNFGHQLCTIIIPWIITINSRVKSLGVCHAHFNKQPFRFATKSITLKMHLVYEQLIENELSLVNPVSYHVLLVIWATPTNDINFLQLVLACIMFKHLKLSYSVA